MALQTDFTSDDGTFYPNSYIEISRYGGSNNDAEIYIEIWKNQEEHNLKLPSIQTRWYSFEYDLESSDNILIQGYDYLQTCPEFTNSIYI